MRLLLVEDNAELVTLLAAGLGRGGFSADVVATATDALSALLTTRYAAVVLDLGLPDEDGLTVLRQLRRRGDSTPVLVLTARSGVGDRVEGLKTGADDYLVKPFAMEELVARLQALLRRPNNLLGQSLTCGNLSFDTHERQVTIGDTPHALPARETAVLEILMRRSGKVASKLHIEDQLFGFSSDVGSNAVEVYVHRLRKLLVDRGATVKIHTVRGVGYMLSENKQA